MNIDGEINARIAIVVDKISTLCHEIVLYGSQVHNKSLSRDIDLFILADKENKKSIYREIANAQTHFNQVIHAVVINHEDLSVNQDIRVLHNNGEKVF